MPPLRPRTLPTGFIQPCLPTKAPRVIARKDGARVRLYSRPGNDLTRQFPLIVEAMAKLRSLLHHRRRGGRL